ncbi:hypothetical protein WG902_13005 [Ramlibacter sp. PS3R-8]|uniref:hypothetical protein n=1 Tax=Ramlibacter sp. PS3R-8 TaxID=3133437 RepID=UPI00309C41F8
MPSSDAASTPSSPATAPVPACAAPAFALAQASRALWSATLGLMTAFMHTPAPAHRYLLARRIGRNFETLSGQECFDARSRASFERLASRWLARSEEFAPEPARPRGGLLRLLS